MAAFSLIPRDVKFYDEFVALAEQIRAGARMLRDMLGANPLDMSRVAAIKDLEHVCDERTRGIVDRLNRTFVTPLDREDIHSLAIKLDDVMDAVEAAAAVLRLYKIERSRPGAYRLAELVCEAMDRICEALAALEKRKGVLELVARINQIEREADRMHQDAILALFDEEHDPISVMKWKEILDFLEAATDRCQDVSDTIEGIIVKHA
jgi:predicted phosphate transport protein (TIGR00153 family)